MTSQTIQDLPVRPDLDQLRNQAKDLLKAIRSGKPEAIATLTAFGTKGKDPSKATLAEVQFALARSYAVASWPRLVRACHMIDAIWRGDENAVRDLILKDPKLLTENARGTQHDNWGPPMSHAANVGADSIVLMLREMGAQDLQFAFERACLRGQLRTARKLLELGARPKPGSVMGPCETLNAEGLKFQLDLGAPITDEKGDALAPIGLILQTYSRNPSGKHGCLQLLADVGIVFPDTPPMEVHRGRRDLLETHLAQDPDLFSRTFRHDEIFPPSLGCSEDPIYALHGAPLNGGTLLHMCVDYDEYELAAWMIQRGADVNARAAVDAEGFGGHTALYGVVVNQPYRTGRSNGRFLDLLLSHGADPSLKASLFKELRFVKDETRHEFRNVTAYDWGVAFQDQDWVNPVVLARLKALSSV